MNTKETFEEWFERSGMGAGIWEDLRSAHNQITALEARIGGA